MKGFKFFSNLAIGLRWNLSLGLKFLRVVPFLTTLIVLLTLISQLTMLLASFLPLKVVIMLGSDGIPRYFPEFLASMERNALISVLTGGTIGFFIAHIVSEKMIQSATRYATSKLLAKSKKMVLFENQEEIAANAYQRYSRALAGGVFIALSLLSLGWFYSEISLVMLCYFIFVALVFWVGSKYSISFHDLLLNKLSEVVRVWGTIGFFVVFGYLVFDFIFLSPPGVIVALVSFLLARQTMQRATSMVIDLRYLYQQKPKLNALFFHKQVLLPEDRDSKASLWPLLMPETRNDWIKDVLNSLLDSCSDNLLCKWYQFGNSNVSGLLVERDNESFLLKLYEENRRSLAIHEADLMVEQPQLLPAAKWLGMVPVDKLYCIVYQLDSGNLPDTRQLDLHSYQVRSALFAVQPSTAGVQRYIRSKAMLWQRLQVELLNRLWVAVCNEEQEKDLSLLLEQLPILQHMLSNLPLVISNPEMGRENIWVFDEAENSKQAILLNWGRWTLEPIGAGWPVSEKQLTKLEDALESAAKCRKELKKIKSEHAELAALSFALEREYSRLRFKEALAIIPRILKRLTILKEEVE